jgi:hypothetical protein
MRNPGRLAPRRIAQAAGRRSACPLACLAVAAVIAIAPAAAAADIAMVSATVYPSNGASVATDTVQLSKLQTCSTYSGPSSLAMNPSGIPYQLPSSTWTVATVLQCGLSLLIDGSTSVQVLTTNRGYEAPLSFADLTDPSQYHDIDAPGALPVISNDGGDYLDTYTRPYRGGNDGNARDQVSEDETPISIVVYVSGAPLRVDAVAHTLSHTAKTKTVKFTATVHGAGGAQIAPSALTWSWSFNGSPPTSAATPRYTFGLGVSYVAVRVTDASTGSGGTATLEVGVTNTGPPARHGHSGGGDKPSKSKSSTGSERKTSTGTNQGQEQSSHHKAAVTTPTTQQPPPTTTSSAPASSPAPQNPRSQATHAARLPRRKPAAERQTVRRQGSSRLVTGLLVSDVTPLPPGASPLWAQRQPPGAPPQIRQAASESVMTVPVGVLAVLALFGLGVSTELRGRRRIRAPRSAG